MYIEHYILGQSLDIIVCNIISSLIEMLLISTHQKPKTTNDIAHNDIQTLA